LIIVRLATSADADAITDVQLATWRATYNDYMPDVVAAMDRVKTAANWAKATAQQGQHVAAALRDQQLVGYAHSGPADAADHVFGAEQELYALYVHPDAQGLGAGRALVGDALATRNACWIVWALEDYAPARRFYESQGFELVPDVRRPWRGLTEVLYRRRATVPS
jgi:GNAT superfamily N-acetyltransferase